MRHHALLSVVCIALTTSFLSPQARAQLSVESRYIGLGRALETQIDVPADITGEPSIVLVNAGDPMRNGRTAPVEPGRADLATLFPVIWTTNAPAVMYAQLTIGNTTVGPPLVIEPMLTPIPARDGFTDALLDAAEARNDDALRELARLPADTRTAMKQAVILDESARRVFCGYVVYEKRDIVLDTTLGELRIATRPDAAPIASRRFADLVAGGFYDGVAFHRVIADDGRGRPFVAQAGDPTGLGRGGAGASYDFEPSDLPHDYGVLSVARRRLDPNSNGSQFFVCLSREACAALDGLYTSFAEIVEGGPVVRALIDVETVLDGVGEVATRTDRPVEPPVILDARTVPSPPIDAFAPRVLPFVRSEGNVER